MSSDKQVKLVCRQTGGTKEELKHKKDKRQQAIKQILTIHREMDSMKSKRYEAEI